VLLQFHYLNFKQLEDKTIYKVCNKPVPKYVIHAGFWQKYIVDASAPTDPSMFLDNEFHPIFAEDNWVAPPTIPMSILHDQLRPAFQLASQLITNERTLQWFTYVRFSTFISQENGPNVLHSSEPILPYMLDKVKVELLAISPRVQFGWMGSSVACNSTGVTINTLGQLANLLASDEVEGTYFEREHSEWLPSILINVSLLHTALQHKHRGATPIAQRILQLALAKLLIHELAHVWFFRCHKFQGQNHLEPTVYPGEAFPQCGFSFETFIFGARLQLDGNGEILLVTALASEYRTPRHELCVCVPHAWIHRWFLQATWRNFAELHERGELYAPSTDRQVTLRRRALLQ
jgi:hypothetical protein